MNVADLDRAMLRRDAQVGGHPSRAAGFVEEGEEERIPADGVLLQPAAPLVHAGRRVGGQIGEACNAGASAQRRIESLGVLRCVERFDGAVAAAKAATLR